MLCGSPQMRELGNLGRHSTTLNWREWKSILIGFIEPRYTNQGRYRLHQTCPRWCPRHDPDDAQDMPQMMPKTCPRWCPIHAPDMPQMIPQTCPRWCPRVVPTSYRWHWIQWYKQTCLGSAVNNQSHRNLFCIRKVYLSHILHCTCNLYMTEHTWSHTLSVYSTCILCSFISTTHAMNSQAVIEV